MSRIIIASYSIPNLDEKIEWHPREQDVGKEFDDSENGEDDPIGEPLDVVILILRFERLASKVRASESECECHCRHFDLRSVSGVNDANEVAQKCRGVAEEEIEAD